MPNYVTYHLHTELSLLDSCTNYKLYVDKAAELGQTAIAFTEHGNIFSWIEKKMYANSKGLKYIHGVEIYLTETLDEKIRDNYHTILLAKNHEGVKEINLLIDKSTQEDHFYYKPRISFDEFLNISDNVIKISACLASPLKKYNGDRLEDLIKHYDYLEIQPHINSIPQKKYNAQLVEWSKKYNKPLIAGTDTHSIDKYKAECRTMLQLAKRIVFAEEDSYDLTYKTYDELFEMFYKQNVLTEEQIEEALNNTQVMADSVEDFELDTSFKYPKVKNEEETLKARVNEMYQDKVNRGIIKPSPEYKKRVQEELRVFKKIDMMGFMVFMSQITCWCWKNDIPIGFCRGSVGGSLIAYLLDITDVNPIVWGTVFSRFANEDRKEIGDIDIDLPPTKRQMVYDHIIEEYGLDKTAYVVSFGTISDKGAIDEIARALCEKDEKNKKKYSLAETKKIKDLYEENSEEAKEQYPELFYYFEGMKGCVVSQGLHPAAIVISPVTLPDNYGTFWSKDKKILTIDMEEIHEVSLVKYDLLGLVNIEIIEDCCKLANIPYPKAHEVDWNDDEVWEHIADSGVGIFQLESDFATSCMRKMKCHSINDLSMVNGCIRPAGESYRDELLSGKIHKNVSPMLDELLKSNRGYLCVAKDQYVSLLNGRKKIQNIQVGDEVYTKNGTSVVTKVFNNGVKNCVEVIVGGNKLICTEDHKILSHKGFLPVSELQEGDCVGIRIGNASNNTEDDYKLQLIGYLIGDGCLSLKRNTITFYNLDENVVKNYHNVVEKFENCTTTTYQKENGLYVTRIKSKCPTKKKNAIVKYMEELKMHHTLSINKKLPEFMFGLNKDSLLVFLGAYTDTDCCISGKAVHCTYKTSSVDLAHDIVEVLRLCGYLSNITPDKLGGFAITVSNAKRFLQDIYKYSYKVRKHYAFNDLTELRKSTNLIPVDYIRPFIKGCSMKKIGISISKERKYVTINKLRRINDAYGVIPKHLFNKNIMWMKIKEIKEVGEKQVYDLTIKNEHNFICQGIVTHNCFQEDTIKFLTDICGLEGSEADNIRRAIGRKQRDRLEKALPQILEGYCEKSPQPRPVAEKEAKEFLQILEDSAEYQFGFNHSTGYSMIGYYCAWLRYHYPTEFITAFLNNANDENDIINGTKLAKDLGITISGIKFRFSEGIYTCDGKQRVIYKGLASIKYLNDTIAEDLNKFKDKQYSNFIDLLIDIQSTSVNSRQLDILIKLNYFEEFGEINALLKQVELFNSIYGKKQFKKDKIDLPEYLLSKYSHKETEKMFKDIDSYGLLKEVCETTDYSQTRLIDKIIYENDLLGYIQTVLPKMDGKYYFVTQIKTLKGGNKLAYLCQLNSGNITIIKIRKKVFNKNKIEKDDVIKMLEISSENKWSKDENGNWIRLEQREDILTKYKVCKGE